MSDQSKHECGCGHQHGARQPIDEVPEGAIEEVFRVRGLDCPEEIAAVKKVVKPMPGILGVHANIMASSVTIYHDGSVGKDLLIQAINKSGLRVQTGNAQKEERSVLSFLFVTAAGVLTGLGILLGWGGAARNPLAYSSVCFGDPYWGCIGFSESSAFSQTFVLGY